MTSCQHCTFHDLKPLLHTHPYTFWDGCQICTFVCSVYTRKIYRVVTEEQYIIFSLGIVIGIRSARHSGLEQTTPERTTKSRRELEPSSSRRVGGWVRNVSDQDSIGVLSTMNNILYIHPLINPQGANHNI